MTNQQQRAARLLERALDRCHKAGLEGGMYGSSFMLWPIKHRDKIYDQGWHMFERVQEHGEILITEMNIDGGAGV